MPETVCFDADDTLWHNERYFRLTQDRFAELLADHADPARLSERLLAAERRNLGRYGYGIKGFALSMIETALEVTGDRVPGAVIRDLIDAVHEMLDHPIDLLPGVEDAIGTLRGRVRLVIVTKGDLLDQERKIAQSGIGEAFDAVEIVSEKTAAVYGGVMARHEMTPDATVMVGNSLRSDVLPMIEAGGWGVHVPHDLTWDLEQADAPEAHPRFRRIDRLDQLPGLIDSGAFAG